MKTAPRGGIPGLSWAQQAWVKRQAATAERRRAAQ